jgi:hypothetical protein
MANLEKHKKNPVQEWLEGEDSTVPAQPRSSHVLGAYIKIPKTAVARKFRPSVGNPTVPRLEPALVREPAPPPKLDEKHSQATSREHLLKSQRLPKLRAPFLYRTAAPSPAGANKPVTGPPRVRPRAATNLRRPARQGSR